MGKEKLKKLEKMFEGGEYDRFHSNDKGNVPNNVKYYGKKKYVNVLNRNLPQESFAAVFYPF